VTSDDKDEENRPLSEDGPLSPGFEMHYDTLRGEQGIKGETGERGETGKPGGRLPAVQARAIVYLFVINLIFVIACLGAFIHYAASTRAALLHQQQTYEAGQRHEQAEQRAAGAQVIRKLCTTFGELAANKPPAGNPDTNPSRGYDQRNHRILDGVGPDIGCAGSR
jgi:hypothetical protein